MRSEGLARISAPKGYQATKVSTARLVRSDGVLCFEMGGARGALRKSVKRNLHPSAAYLHTAGGRRLEGDGRRGAQGPMQPGLYCQRLYEAMILLPLLYVVLIKTSVLLAAL